MLRHNNYINIPILENNKKNIVIRHNISMQLRSKQIQFRVWELDKYLINQYKEQVVQKKKRFSAL